MRHKLVCFCICFTGVEQYFLDILVQPACDLTLEMNTSQFHDFKFIVPIVHKKSALKSDYII